MEMSDPKNCRWFAHAEQRLRARNADIQANFAFSQ
jgi:hypothetical protein